MAACLRKMIMSPGLRVINNRPILPIGQIYNKQKSNWLSSSQEATKEIFELRTYSVHPSKMGEFLSLTQKEFHLRTKHSKLLAYWIVEFGGLNQVVHIWPYDNLGHRSEVRAKLAENDEWNSKYIAKVLPAFQTQDNVLLTSLAEHLPKISKECAFYELQIHRMRTSQSAWSYSLEEFLKSATDLPPAGSSSLAGAFKTIIGPLNSMVLVWQHPTAESCAKLEATLSDNVEYQKLSSHFLESSSKNLRPFVLPLWS